MKKNTLKIMKRNSYVIFVEKASFLKIVVKCINLVIILKRVVKYVEKCALTSSSWRIIWALSIKWKKWNWNAKSVHFLQILNQAWNPTFMLITTLKITRNVLTVNIILICSIVFRFSMITVVEFEVKKTKRSEKKSLKSLDFVFLLWSKKVGWKNNWPLLFDKVNVFWEGHKILRNLHLTFDWHYTGQK